MAFRLRFVPKDTKVDFMRIWRYTLGASVIAAVASIVLLFTVGLNFGIDFKGGTTIRTQSTHEVNVGAYRKALEPLGLGDVGVTEIFDPGFAEGVHAAQIRIQAGSGETSADPATIDKVETALKSVDSTMTFPSIESVGPKVSGELVKQAVMAVGLAILATVVYIWLRFEWQFALGAVVALIHDVTTTIGLFCLLGMKFDLTIIAALLTIVGYSLNDTVIVFDRIRENLQKFKKMALKDVINLSLNETLSRTTMTSFTTLLALLALFFLGGDVIRGFVFAMIWGVLVGTYSSIYVAGTIILNLGVKRDWSKKTDGKSGTKFANIDA